MLSGVLLALSTGSALAQLSGPSPTPGRRAHDKPVVREVAAAAPARPAGCDFETVYSLDSASLDRAAPRPTLTARGTVRTGGWSNGTLLRVSRSPDGATQTFRFVACPPRGFYTMALAPIDARQVLGGDLSRLQTIVVTSETETEVLDMARYRETLKRAP